MLGMRIGVMCEMHTIKLMSLSYCLLIAKPKTRITGRCPYSSEKAYRAPFSNITQIYIYIYIYRTIDAPFVQLVPRPAP